jgi:hypothetical protein
MSFCARPHIKVKCSSLEELLLDYEDFLRHRRLPQWSPEAPEAEAVRRAYTRDLTDPTDQKQQYLQYLAIERLPRRYFLYCVP